MKSLLLIALCAAVATALPKKRFFSPNPDEWYYDIKGDLPPLDKNGLVNTQYRWPNGVVAYELATTIDAGAQSIIEQAMQHYRDVTAGCIDFQPRTTQLDYVRFKQDPLDNGCWSYVGKIGGAQEINYPDWCLNTYGSVLHEMYHALGFYHEQSRFDRDTYVTIMTENIQAGAENNFNKYPESYANGFGEPYDYTSVMHYSAYAFSSNGQMTIVTVDPAFQDVIGQRVDLSQIDINKLMLMYNC